MQTQAAATESECYDLLNAKLAEGYRVTQEREETGYAMFLLFRSTDGAIVQLTWGE
jgi:hypothetical protein